MFSNKEGMSHLQIHLASMS